MKVIHILLIIIFILFAILGIRVYKSNSEPEYSLYDIQKILDKAENIKNYECKLEDGKIYKRKNNVVCIIEKDYKHIIDYNSNKHIVITKNTKTYLETQPSTNNIITSNSYAGISGNNILSVEGLEIIKAKEVMYNGNKCLKVNFKITQEIPMWLQKEGEESIISAEIEIWINKDNGLIMKAESDETGKSIEYTYKFDTVTDEDVNPDLSGYKKLEIDT